MTFKTPGRTPHHAHVARRLGGCWVLLALTLGGVSLQAGEGPGVASLANREVARRQAMLGQAETLIGQGAAAEAKPDYVEALRDYKAAYDLLPNAPMAASLRDTARDGYSRAANAQARKLAQEARYGEARQLLATVLADDFDPDNPDAKLFLKQLDDPVRFEPALTPEHRQKVEKVTTLLRDAHSLYNLGDYDGAMRHYEDVIRLDAYNTAARRGMEKIEQEKARYFNAAYDQHRAKMLNDVNAAWEEQVPVLDVSQLFGGGAGPGAVANTRDSIVEKLRTWIVPMVDLQSASLDEVIEFLRIRSRDIDPQKKGISFVLNTPPDSRTKPVTLALTQVPLEELLRYITQMTGTAYHVDEYAVTITSLSALSTTMIQRFYRVPPDFIANAPITEDPTIGAGPVNPFAKGTTANLPQNQTVSMHRITAKEFLTQRGVTFPDGASANYVPTSSTLMVRNTVENLTTVEALVDQARTSSPKQVEIRVRLIDVDQTNMNEMGFDWTMGQSNLPGSSGIFTSGGTTAVASSSGTTASSTNTDYPFTIPTSSSSPTVVGTDSVTSGLRSSGAITGVSTIDSLLTQNVGSTPTINSKSGGVFSVAGVFTDPQFQMVIRALSQKKGVDLLAAPSVVTRSGQRATVVVAREFPYPTQFNPPQIPQNISTVIPGGNVNTIFTGANLTAPVTPTTPTAFAVRNVGITLEVEPVVDANNRLVHLQVVPSDTEFEGFVNYGSDITTTAGGIMYTQPNHIFQPIFRSTKSTTSVDVWDGQTVALAGVISENRTDIEDKVPFIGSIPIIGRLFQSKVSQTERRNVAFFVTVRIIDPGGNPVNQVMPSAAVPIAPPVAAAAP